MSIINDWLHSNPYLVSDMEIRRANESRFNVSGRETQICWMHIIFSGQQIHFWLFNHETISPKQLFALGFIEDNYVAFEWEDSVEMVAPADPKFFEWLESCFKRIIKKAETKSVGSVRKIES